MGYYSDLGTSIVSGLCPATGYPHDEHGHLLDTLDPNDGTPIPGWDKAGTKLYNFTNPYGHLHFACGSCDDFHRFDYHTLNAGPRGEFIILDSTINSETGCFIMGGTYQVLPCNSTEQKRYAVSFAQGMVDIAVEWCFENGLRHNKSGWNQDENYFVRSVAASLFDFKFKTFSGGKWTDKFSERQFRLGGKKIDAIVRELMCERGIFGDVMEAQK